MKLIKKGREQQGWAQEFKCSGKGNGGGGCDALLLVEQGDLFRTYESHQGETDSFVTFECSECKVHTDLPSFTHPPRINELPTLQEWAAKRSQHFVTMEL